MYFISSINSNNWPKFGCHRCFGYYNTEEEARRKIEMNFGEMQEYYYDHIIIEFIDEGIHRTSNTIQWYKWNDNKWNGMGKEPDFAKGTKNWAIG